MASKISHIFGLLMLFGILIGGCKGSGTDPNGNTTHIDIGDSIPRQHSNYTFSKSQLDQNGNVLPGSIFKGFAIIDTEGISFLGKNNVYSIVDDGDKSYYAYEPSSDVSIFFKNPGFFIRYPGNDTDVVLQSILDTVFQNWITFPIATKKTGQVIYDQTKQLFVTGDYISTKIHAVTDYIGDSTIIISSGEAVLSKHCKLTITAVFDPLTYPGITITHIRDIWFVPKIGYIAKLLTRTNVPYIQLRVVNTDTTSAEKTLTSFTLL